MSAIDSMNEKRVCFDFEVEFSNGGGIQGQGFRLDIDGDDIVDDELAAYIIRDMRLLMVSEVRILNKKIIQERHKRAAAIFATSEVTDPKKQMIDLSHTIDTSLVTLKGFPTGEDLILR
jgi:arylformamidase